MSRILQFVLILSLAENSAFASPLQGTQTNETQLFYGVLLDTGSSSSKLKIYTWTQPITSPGVPNITLIDLPKEKCTFKPGMAQLKGDLDSVKTYLLNILKVATETIPASQQAETPVFVLATAGFRLLGVDGAREGMEVVEEILMDRTLHPFKYTAGSASVLSGEEEAAYSWIAANYLLGFFHNDRPDSESVGVLEMGGASTQIAFIPRDPLMAEEFHVILAGRQYSLYVQSYLTFGLDAINRRLETDVIQARGGALDKVDQPCMLHGDAKSVMYQGKNVLLQGSGNPLECQTLLDRFLATAPHNECFLEPCAIGSVFQPSVEGIDFYAISAFLYPLNSVGAIRSDGTLDLNTLWTKAREFCLQNISEIPENRRKYGSLHCMGAIYTHELFTKPYGFSKSTDRIKATSNIGGNDVEWALGAMLELLSLSFTGDPNHCSLARN